MILAVFPSNLRNFVATLSNVILIISSTRRGTNLLGSRISFNHPWTDWCPPAPEVCGLGAGEGVGWREGKGGSRRGLGWVGSSDGDGRRGFKTTKIWPAKTNRWVGNSLRVAARVEKLLSFSRFT